MSKNIIKHDLPELVQNYMMSYSAYTLLHRAIPDFRDGLKPSTMRTIFSMYDNKMFKFTKSLDVVGTVSKIHNHGSVYPTIVGMCQTDKHSHPYLDYNGNMGQHTSKDLQASADRYTDIRLSEFTRDLLADNLKKDVVDFEPNYDGTIQVPLVLPVRFPTILTHAQSGIGVGFASNIASFNLKEIADAVIDIVSGRKPKTLIPDFATGGYILKDVHSFDTINLEGSGTVRLRGKATINKNEISITEIPYTTTREAIIDKIVELAQDKLPEVTNVIDLTGNDKMEILVTARRNTNMELLLEKLYTLTPLESTHSSNNMVIVDGLPKQLGVVEILELWIKWRKKCIQRGINYEIRLLEKSLFELNTLKKLYNNDKLQQNIIKIVRFANNKTEAIEDIYKLEDSLTYRECEFIYNLRLNQFNSKYLAEQLTKIIPIQNKIKELENFDIEQQIIDDMKFFKKKYGIDRKTKIVELEVKEIQEKIERDLLDDSDYWITITDNGYLFKTERKNDKKNILPTDKIMYQWKINNVDGEIFTLNHSRDGVKIQIIDLELGEPYFIPSLTGCDLKDVIDYGYISTDTKYLVLLLTQGRIVKIDIDNYKPGVNVYKNTHTNRFEITHTLILDDDTILELTDIEGNTFKLDTKDIRTTKTRTGSGQYINRQRIDIKSVK